MADRRGVIFSLSYLEILESVERLLETVEPLLTPEQRDSIREDLRNGDASLAVEMLLTAVSLNGRHLNRGQYHAAITLVKRVTTRSEEDFATLLDPRER